MNKAIPYILIYMAYVAIYMVVLAFVYPTLPDIVPSHWAGVGPEPTDYQPKASMALFGLAMIFIVPAFTYPLVCLTALIHRTPLRGKAVHIAVAVGSGFVLAIMLGYFGYIAHPSWFPDLLAWFVIMVLVAQIIGLAVWQIWSAREYGKGTKA
jgi:hypothetical protein